MVICYSLIMKKGVVPVCCTDNDEGATYTLCGHIVVSPNRATPSKTLKYYNLHSKVPQKGTPPH